MSHFTELAREQSTASILGEVVTAVPVTGLPDGKSVAGSGGTTAAAMALPGLAGLAAALLMPIVQLVGWWRSRDGSAEQQRGKRSLLLVFRPAHVEIVELRSFGRKLGRILATHPLDGVSYRREGLAIDTRVHIDGEDWPVHGWFERELRAVLGPLGVRLERLPAAQPSKEIEQRPNS